MRTLWLLQDQIRKFSVLFFEKFGTHNKSTMIIAVE